VGEWEARRGSDPDCLAVVDGTGPWEGHGPHYSRRTPGSRTFTGVGRQVVLYHPSGAVWSVVYQRTPQPRGTVGAATPFVWRNNVFRNLGPKLSSDLIRAALDATLREWVRLYGELPEERLRTEVLVNRVRSRNPGYCYQCAGWERGPVRRGVRFFYAPRASNT